jgi:Predicted glycosyltransferases
MGVATVLVVIPTLDPASERLGHALRSLHAVEGGHRIEIVVVDNTAGGHSELADPALAELLRAGLNLGWAGGLAWGSHDRDFDYLWLVQDDVVVTPGSLDALVTHLNAHPGVAAVAPLVVRDGVVPAGTCGARWRDGGFTAFPPAGVDPGEIDLDSPDYVPSRGTLVRGDAWRAVGGMSSRYYPLMWADVDLSLALRAQGHEVAFCREAIIDHAGSASGSGTLSRFLWARNRELVAHRWGVDLGTDDPDDVLSSRPTTPAQLDAPLPGGLPPGLVADTARHASDAFLHLARWSDATRRRLVRELDWYRTRAEHAETAAAALDVSTRALSADRDWWRTRALEAEKKSEWLAAVAAEEASKAPPAVEQNRRLRTLRLTPWAAFIAVGAVLIALQHFRPWEGGLLEDWSFAVKWLRYGWSFFPEELPSTLGRPLHHLPVAIGLALGDGGIVGQFAVLAVVAVLQFFVVLRILATRPIPRTVTLVGAFAAASHPLWAAGDILRFLPAQASALAFWIAVACWFRVSDGGRRRVAVGGAAAIALGLLSYQALALTAVLAAFAIWAIRSRGLGRLGLIVGATVAATGLVGLWSVVIAPRLVPRSYESTLGNSFPSPVDSIVAVLRTLVTEAPWIVVVAVVSCVALAAVALTRLMSRRAAGVLGAMILVSPLTGLTYATSPLHLNDPERIGFPVSTTIVVAILIGIAALPWGRVGTPTTIVASIAAALACVVGTAFGIAQWTGYGLTQQRALELVAPAVADAEGDEVVLVRDSSGILGDVYTLLPPHFTFASLVTTGDPTVIELCTETGTPRNHPIAARYPIGTTQDCDVVAESYGTGRLVTMKEWEGGSLRVEIVRPNP